MLLQLRIFQPVEAEIEDELREEEVDVWRYYLALTGVY